MREFSILGFAEFLGTLSVGMHEANHHALEGAAVILEDEAKRVIGTYEYGWPPLAEATKADRLKQGYSEDEPGLRSGEMRDSIQHEVHHDEAHVGSNDDKLVWFDQGTKTQPPRSVLMGAAVHKETEIIGKIGRVMVAHLSGTALTKLP